MQAIGLIERCFGGDPLEKERVERHVVLCCKIRIDRLESTSILRAKVRSRAHPDQQNSNLSLREAAQDLCQCLARDARIDAHQHVVCAKFNDHRIRPLRDRPIEPGEPACRRIA